MREAWAEDGKWGKARQVLCLDVPMHKAFIRNAATLCVDVFFLPFLFLLVLTMWRARPALVELRRSLDWTTRKCIVRQFAFLTADVLAVVPCVVVIALWYRSGPVRADIRCVSRYHLVTDLEQADRPAEVSQHELKYHRAVLRATLLHLLDVICLPGVLLLLVITPYRLPAIYANLPPKPDLELHKAIHHECWEMLLDVPALIAAALLILMVYRADLLLRILRDGTLDAGDRREAICTQLLYMLRDAAMVPPLLLLAVTLYRLPKVCIALKSKLCRPLASEAEMEPASLSLTLPRPSGRLGFRVRASKSPNLSGVSAMRLHLVGERFWQSVAEYKGAPWRCAGV